MKVRVRVAVALSVLLVFVFVGSMRPSQIGVVNPLPPASPDWAYKLAAGPLEVRMVPRIRLHDEERGRDVPVTLVHPGQGGPYPIVIYSHGAGATGQYDYPIARFWASHGYVVVQPTHADTETLDIPDEERSDIKGSDLWISRARDISLIIDSLHVIEEMLPQLRGRMDPDVIGVSGHSLGALTAQMVGGVRLRLAEGTPLVSFGDGRPRAFLLLSGQGRGDSGLVDGSWDAFARPMMAMAGSRDPGPRGVRPEWRGEPFELSPAGDKYYVFIDSATHYSYPGLYDEGRKDPRIEAEMRVFDYVKTSTIAFWDAYLKQDAPAKAFLSSGAIQKGSNTRVQVSSK
jgi:predicted dienelactone hydrolase